MQDMPDILLQAAAIIVPLVIAIVFHEVAHGYAALMLGDPTAREQRRLSLNPLRHVHPVGTILVPGALALSGLPVFGWARPVPVNQHRLRDPRGGMMAVAAAGPATNFVLAAVGAVALGVLHRAAGGDPGPMALFALTSLSYFIAINVFLALFNLLPLPPFDGSHIVEGVLPRRLARGYARFRPIGLPLMILVLVIVPQLFPGLGLIETVVMPPVAWMLERYDDLARAVAALV